MRASLDTEARSQLLPSDFRHPDGTATIGAAHPFQVEEAPGQGDAELAREVGEALGRLARIGSGLGGSRSELQWVVDAPHAAVERRWRITPLKLHSPRLRE
jgi:hypothetical protein